MAFVESIGLLLPAARHVNLAESVDLHADSIGLLPAAEYQLSATAVILHIIQPPIVSVDGVIPTAA